MRITDELRPGGIYMSPANRYTFTAEELTAIADRIDAEYQKAIRELNYLAGASVLLPVDADGEPIHIGDVMAYADNTKPMEVIALVPPSVFLTEDGPRYADMCRHYQPPTVEDVLREMLSKYDELRLGPSAFDPFELMAEYAAKLQLREDA